MLAVLGRLVLRFLGRRSRLVTRLIIVTGMLRWLRDRSGRRAVVQVPPGMILVVTPESGDGP